MPHSATQFTVRTTCIVAAAALLATFALASPALAVPTAGADRVEARITMLHAKLAITPAQEDLWTQVTQVMRDNAQTMEALTKARAAQAPTLTAVADLTSYSEITNAHAEGLKKFIPVFAALYGSMSDAQKAQADTLFRGHHRTAAKPQSKRHVSASPAASTTP